MTAKENETPLKNDEAVRIYRLERLEENQAFMLDKLDDISEKLDKNYRHHLKNILKCDKRISKLEQRASRVDKLIWIIVGVIIAESVGILSAFVLAHITLI